MSCYSCTENFGMFRREHSCMKCQLSFCSKCLSYKAVVPNKGTKAHHVCRSCYKLLTTPPDPEKQNNANQRRLSPPENFKRRLEALAAKKSEPKQTGGMQTRLAPKYNVQAGNKETTDGLTAEDKKLVERLNKLKEDRKKEQGRIPSTEEMEKRLRALKGLPTDQPSTSQPKPYFPSDNRNLHEQFNDLMDEMTAEVELEGRLETNNDDEDTKTTEASEGGSETRPMNNDKISEEDIKRLMKESEEELKRARQQNESDSEMAARLARLQGLDPEKAKLNFKSKGVYDVSSDEDDEAATRKLLKQLAEEDKLNEKVKESGNEDILKQADHQVKHKEKGYKVDPEELPWCCICNEDAALRCLGCEGDLYCNRCFKEGHNNFDHDHVTERYKPTKKIDK